MASYIGRQYVVADFLGTASSTMLDFSVFDDECIPSPALLHSLARIRAFAVPSLEGRHVSASHDGAFAAAVESVLRQSVPGVAWLLDLDPTALRKHLFFETTLAAPHDETTGMPMALHVFGNVIVLDGVASGTREWDRKVDAWRLEALARIEAQRPPAPLAVPFTARIEVATYANVQSCGVGVPFYS